MNADSTEIKDSEPMIFWIFLFAQVGIEDNWEVKKKKKKKQKYLYFQFPVLWRYALFTCDGPRGTDRMTSSTREPGFLDKKRIPNTYLAHV